MNMNPEVLASRFSFLGSCSVLRSRFRVRFDVRVPFVVRRSRNKELATEHELSSEKRAA